ncbi:MAG: hypothetical protein RI897_3265 [Verrucomicrobiota bacterium]
MSHELPDQADADQGAGDVGCEPAGITHHLKGGAAVGGGHLELVIGVATVAEGIVHPDFDFAVFPGFGVIERDEGAEVFGYFRSGIDIVPALDQREGEGFVVAFGSEGEFVGAAVVGEGLGLGDGAGQQP